MTLSRRIWRRHALVALLAPMAVLACGPRVRPAPGPPPVPPARTSVPVTSEPPRSTLPRELTALLPGAGRASGEAFDLRIGVAPVDFPRDLLPPGTAIGASAIGDRATVVVGTNADLTTAGRAREPMRLASIGWNNVMPPRRGFTGGTGDLPLSVCRDVDFASITFVDRPAGGSFVRVTLTKDPRRSCVPRPDLGFNLPDVPIPVCGCAAAIDAGRDRTRPSARSSYGSWKRCVTTEASAVSIPSEKNAAQSASTYTYRMPARATLSQESSCGRLNLLSRR